MQPATSYLICATPRSGSTLLCEALTNTGLAGCPKEYFEALKDTGRPRRPQEYFDPSDTEITTLLQDIARLDDDHEPPLHPKGENYRDYLARVMVEGTTPNGVFGAKVMWEYFDDFVQHLHSIPEYEGIVAPLLLPTIFPDLHYIRMTRSDKVRQAISLWKAVQTQAWKMEEALHPHELHHRRKLVFHYRAIDYLRQRLVDNEAAWQRHFEHYGIEPMLVVYEDLVASYEETALNILRFLRVPIPPNFAFAERRMKQQADTLSEDWVRRYYAFQQKREKAG